MVGKQPLASAALLACAGRFNHKRPRPSPHTPAPQAYLLDGPLGRSGFLAAFSLIFLSEMGDKTFFIAALLAMRLGRCGARRSRGQGAVRVGLLATWCSPRAAGASAAAYVAAS